MCWESLGFWAWMFASSLSPLWVSLHFCFWRVNSWRNYQACLIFPDIETHPLLLAAWSPGRGHHGAASTPSYPPAHNTAAPASLSELRYNPLHPLAKHFWGKTLFSPFLACTFGLGAHFSLSNKSWGPLTHLPKIHPVPGESNQVHQSLPAAPM